MRKKIIIEIEEQTDDGQKIAVKLHGISYEELCRKFSKSIPMPLVEVAAHFMCSKFMEFHQQRAILTAHRKGIVRPMGLVPKK